MRKMKSLQENLKNLPKYSLSENQKNKIILALNQEARSRKKVRIKRPIFAFIVISVLAFVLIFSSESNSWLQELKLSFQPQIELNATEAKAFKNSHDIIGIEGKVGIFPNVQFVAEDARRGAKLMLYFWGDPSKLINKKYRVEAVNRYNEKINLSEGILYSPLKAEDAHTLTSFSPFSVEGKWQLSFFIEEQLFEEFTVDILPPFPKTDHYTLVDSPTEIKVDKEVEINIESFAASKKEITVQLVDKRGNVVANEEFVLTDYYINASDSNTIQIYSGKIKFPERGTWRLIIDGEKTKPFKN